MTQGAEPNATCWVGADGETGDFKGLTLSNSGPVFLGSRGFSFRQGADREGAPTRAAWVLRRAGAWGHDPLGGRS